jgi:hypothetical protein
VAPHHTAPPQRSPLRSSLCLLRDCFSTPHNMPPTNSLCYQPHPVATPSAQHRFHPRSRSVDRPPGVQCAPPAVRHLPLSFTNHYDAAFQSNSMHLFLLSLYSHAKKRSTSDSRPSVPHETIFIHIACCFYPHTTCTITSPSTRITHSALPQSPYTNTSLSIARFTPCREAEEKLHYNCLHNSATKEAP